MTDARMIKIYEEIALERLHICHSCGWKTRLSHSHLVPKSLDLILKYEKQNIVYHCLSVGQLIGCHEAWTSMDAPFMPDFEANMKYIFGANRTYFWERVYKLQEYWEDAFIKGKIDSKRGNDGNLMAKRKVEQLIAYADKRSQPNTYDKTDTNSAIHS